MTHLVSWHNPSDPVVPHLGTVITVGGEPVTSQRMGWYAKMEGMTRLPLAMEEFTLVRKLFASPHDEPLWVPTDELIPVPSRKERGET